MKITALAALFITLASSSYAFELQTIKSADIEAAGITAPAPAASPAAAVQKQYQSLWMSVHCDPSWNESEANDFSADIDVRVRKSAGTFFDASATVDGKYLNLNLSKFVRNFSLSGPGISLSMNEMGGNYNISGNVTGDDNQTTFVNLTVFRSFNAYSYSISGMGINMSATQNSLNGQYDDSQYSKNAVAAVVSLVLAAQVDKMPAQKSMDEKGLDRVWLTIRNDTFGGWNNVEANDPFADIEVGLRKGFNRNWDAEITVDNDRENGTVDNFFTNTWEYRGNRSSLKLDTFGGFNTLEGDLYVKGRKPEMMKIKLDVRTSFGPGQFSISENGLRLNIDRNGVNGQIDYAVYPKKLVAVITAIALGMQQHPQPR
ncbi:MAG TPA: hypothetical protein PKI19_14120 [Elusimicrobiales bacterium]|nr:hypothetical protein [Elusimicrobiales bacterium]